MKQNQGPFTGACGCGANRFRIEGTPLAVHACHCRSCQKRSGSAFSTNMWIDEGDLHIERQELTHRRLPTGSGKGQLRSFCSLCGDDVWTHYLASVPGTVFVRVGCLNEAQRIVPDAQIFVAEKQPWSALQPDIPAFEAFYRPKEQWDAERVAKLKALFARAAERDDTPSQDHPILSFWFGEIANDGSVDKSTSRRWFEKSSEFDKECRERFAAELEALRRGEREKLLETPRGSLAYILLSDQMPRNIYRDTPQAFASDSLALRATLELLDTGAIDSLLPVEKSFALMPLMHSEDAAIHERSIEAFTALRAEGRDNLSYAERHKVIIDRFGRYPHRNQILGRASTDEEIAFLREPGSSF